MPPCDVTGVFTSGHLIVWFLVRFARLAAEPGLQLSHWVKNGLAFTAAEANDGNRSTRSRQRPEKAWGDREKTGRLARPQGQGFIHGYCSNDCLPHNAARSTVGAAFGNKLPNS